MVITMSMVLTCAILAEAKEEEIARKNIKLIKPDETVKNNKALMRSEDIKLNTGLKDNIFSIKNLTQ